MIQTRALRYQYPSGTALSFDDVDAPQGSALLVQGPSGAGKSTWLALVAGLLTPSAGEVIVAGQSLARLPRGERDAWRARAVGFLPQRLHLSEAMTVGRNLALSYFAAGVPEDWGAIQRALAALGVDDLMHRRPSGISGGQAQRVALARTILMQPKVILADEPTASLDDDAAQAALQLLRDAAVRCNATLVIATHDARVAKALPDAALHRLKRSAQPETAA